MIFAFLVELRMLSKFEPFLFSADITHIKVVFYDFNSILNLKVLYSILDL